MAIHSDTSGEPRPDPPADACIARAKGGDRQALGELYDRCRRYLLLIANHELDDQLRAKLGPSDVVQDTLLKAQTNFGRFQGRTDGELKAWLRTILINSLRDTARSFRPGSKRDLARERELQAILAQAPIARTSSAESPSKVALSLEQQEQLTVALYLLPDDYRRVVTLRNLERRSFNEIGAEMSRSSEAARKLWLRAIDRLRELLGGGDESL